jgi:L-ascorbate metabolism protein UlaG (beta-lactamase superfamily)
MSVTLRWFPNSWFEIVSGGTVVDIDPAILPGADRDVPEGLRQADLVLVTHHHRDHCDLDALERVSGPDTVVLAPRLCVASLGGEAHEVYAGDVHDEVPGVRVRVVHAYNTASGTSTNKLHNKGECVGYVVEIDGLRLYHAGDTDLIEEMSQLGPIDVAMLPVGGTFTMVAEEAASAARLIAPRIALPMHSRDTDPADFARLLEGSGIEVTVLEPGVPLVVA